MRLMLFIHAASVCLLFSAQGKQSGTDRNITHSNYLENFTVHGLPAVQARERNTHEVFLIPTKLCSRVAEKLARSHADPCWRTQHRNWLTGPTLGNNLKPFWQKSRSNRSARKHLNPRMSSAIKELSRKACPKQRLCV